MQQPGCKARTVGLVKFALIHNIQLPCKPASCYNEALDTSR